MAFFKSPTVDELKPFNEKYGFHCTEDELNSYSEVLEDSVQSFQLLYQLPEYVPEVKYPRDCGYRPENSDNPHNAWYWRCSIKGSPSGKLKDKKVGVKDTVFVAGIPMMNGSRVLEGFIPEYDATIVTRMLDEGAEITGKTTCEDYCFSAGSFLTTYGPVRNPWNPKHSAGGSSSGSAVLLATGEVDLAIGGDQGGSIRIPSSECGVVGLKPTYGLVPYTSVAAIDTSLDHVGPMARTVRECAALLEVIAGFDDNNDCRQPSIPFLVPEYTKELDNPVANLKIGVLEEGYNGCADDVVQTVKKAVDIIKGSATFAEVNDVSGPHHGEACAAVMAVILSSPNQVIEGSGHGTGAGGLLSSRLSEAMYRGFKTSSHSMSISLKMCIMFAAYFKDKYGLAPYARAQSLIMKHRRLYDKIFEQVDLLLMPTLPATSPEIPESGEPIPEQIHRAFGAVNNTAPFNGSHHPALTLNAGFSDKNGLPVGLMIVGRHWQDAVVLRAANAIEKVLKDMQTKTLPNNQSS